MRRYQCRKWKVEDRICFELCDSSTEPFRPIYYSPLDSKHQLDRSRTLYAFIVEAGARSLAQMYSSIKSIGDLLKFNLKGINGYLLAAVTLTQRCRPATSWLFTKLLERLVGCALLLAKKQIQTDARTSLHLDHACPVLSNRAFLRQFFLFSIWQKWAAWASLRSRFCQRSAWQLYITNTYQLTLFQRCSDVCNVSARSRSPLYLHYVDERYGSALLCVSTLIQQSR